MALQLTYNSAFGITFSTAYAKILNFSGDSTNITFNIAVWHDKESYDAGNTYLDIFTYTVPHDNSVALSNMYDYLKTLPLFSTAIDV